MSATAIIQRLRRLVIGPPRDPMKPDIRRSIALVGFYAWVGLGADPLSSTMYGPEEAFKALGPHTHLALYLAAATALTTRPPDKSGTVRTTSPAKMSCEKAPGLVCPRAGTSRSSFQWCR